MIRYLAVSKSAAVIPPRPSRTALMAASLTRLARSAGEARRAAGHHLELHARVQLLAPAVNLEDGLPLGQVGQRDGDLAVETSGRSSAGSRTSGRFVAASTTMPSVGSKPSISDSNWLSVAPARRGDGRTRPAAGRVRPARRMKTITGARLRASVKQVPDPGGAHADEHLHEAGACDVEERYVRLAGHRPGDERLSGARRADHEHATRGCRPGLAVPVRVPQKSTTSTISALAPSYPATSSNRVFGRSASNTFARDRPARAHPAVARRRRGRAASTASRTAGMGRRTPR